MPQCKVENCQRPYYAKGWCAMHYVRVRKHGDPLAGRNHAPPAERFWRRVDKSGQNGCWNWTGARLSSGYGSFQVGGLGSPSIGAHRYAWELHYGEPPPPGRALVVMHSCDNRLCVNPHHLSLGTPKDNAQDMHRKGRSSGIVPRGTEHFRAVLNPDTVRMIRASSETNRAIAERLGVGINTIRGVRIGRTWKHVT